MHTQSLALSGCGELASPCPVARLKKKTTTILLRTPGRAELLVSFFFFGPPFCDGRRQIVRHLEPEEGQTLSHRGGEGGRTAQQYQQQQRAHIPRIVSFRLDERAREIQSARIHSEQHCAVWQCMHASMSVGHTRHGACGAPGGGVYWYQYSFTDYAAHIRQKELVLVRA